MTELQRIIEGALMAVGRPLSVQQLAELFDEAERPEPDAIREALEAIRAATQDRGYELIEVASGFRFQVVASVAPWVGKLWEEKPQKYSRALLETLALIAYRQPITRGDIEDIRGVAVSTNIIKTLLEREWVRVVGHKDVPGRPAMYATTRRFLDYFSLRNLDQLPSLAEIRDLETMNQELALEALAAVAPAPLADGESADRDPVERQPAAGAAEIGEAQAGAPAQPQTDGYEDDDGQADDADSACDDGGVYASVAVAPVPLALESDDADPGFTEPDAALNPESADESRIE